jgi:hypothetical protein
MNFPLSHPIHSIEPSEERQYKHCWNCQIIEGVRCGDNLEDKISNWMLEFLLGAILHYNSKNNYNYSIEVRFRVEKAIKLLTFEIEIDPTEQSLRQGPHPIITEGIRLHLLMITQRYVLNINP